MLTLFHQIFTPANTGFMLKGLGMTIVIAVLAILISMFFGTILALIRTYASGRFKWAASLVAVYTEFFRCTPNLLWILWIYFTVKGNKIAVSVFAISLFTSAVMAEIVRGGLNSISKGQFEAAQSQGFSFYPDIVVYHSASDLPQDHPGSFKPGDHSDQRYFFPENGRCGRVHAQLCGCYGQYL